MQPLSCNLITATEDDKSRYWRVLAAYQRVASLPEKISVFIYQRMPENQIDEKGVPTQELLEYLEKSVRIGQTIVAMGESLDGLD
jgi:hypothetical protein